MSDITSSPPPRASKASIGDQTIASRDADSSTIIPEEDATRATPEAIRRHRAMTWIVLLLVTAPLVFATFGGFFGQHAWWLDLLSHFRLQYAFVLAAATAALFFTRRWWTGAIAATALVTNCVLILALYLPPPATPVGDDTFTILHFNLNAGNTNREKVTEYLFDTQPDVMFLQEVNWPWEKHLTTKLMPMRMPVIEGRNDHFGIMMVTSPLMLRRGFSVTRANTIELVPEFGVPAIETIIRFDPGAKHGLSKTKAEAKNNKPEDKTAGPREIAILSLHTVPPTAPDMSAARDRQLLAAAEWVKQQDRPVIVIGDLNATPWSWACRELIERGGLINSQLGHGISATWPSHGGPLGMIPIDHCLHSPDLVVTERRLGPSLGSDHRPLIVTLGFAEKYSPN